MRDELQELADRQYVAPFWHALLDAGLGDERSAMAELQRSYEECDIWLVWLNTDPRFDSLRATPAFKDLTNDRRVTGTVRTAELFEYRRHECN
jgi:hypothetical protein